MLLLTLLCCVHGLDLNAFMHFPSRAQLTTVDDGVMWYELEGGVPSIGSAFPPLWKAAYTSLPAPFDVDHGWDVALHRDGLITVGPMSESNGASRIDTPRTRTYRMIAQWGGVATLSLLFEAPLLGFHSGLPCFVSDTANGSAVYAVDAQHQQQFLFATRTGTVTALAEHPQHPGLSALVSHRGDHSFIGLFDGQATLNWVSPSFDSDISPVWSPRGDKLAWIRQLDLSDDHNRWPFHQGPAYSVLVADIDLSGNVPAVTGANVLYSDWEKGWPDGECGYGQRPLLWAGDSTVVFGSETIAQGSSGFLHVTAVDLSGTARDLTPETTSTNQGCENVAWTMGPNITLYVTHNCGLRETRGVARVDVATGKRTDVVVGTAHMHAGMSAAGNGVLPLANGGVAYFVADWHRPPSVFVLPNATSTVPKELTPYDPARHPSFDNSDYVLPELVSMPSTDENFTLSAQLFTPTHPNGVGLLFTHGGSQRQMYASMHYSPMYTQLYALNQYLAAQGYAVLSLNYRGGVGYGNKFRACDGCGWQGAAEYQDVLQGGKWLAQQPNINKVGLHGLSYGGLNTLQGLTRDPDLFLAGAANAPVFNWVTTTRADGPLPSLFDVAPELNMGYRQLRVGPLPDLSGPDWLQKTQDNVALAFGSSPAGHTHNLKSPILLIQGDNDEDVDFQESRGLLRALRRQLGPQKTEELVEVLVFPDENHGQSVYAHQLRTAYAIVDFFNRRLV